MAGLSAGEVFITLSVKSQGVKPALQKASSLLRNFGKQLSSLSVATGNLIADGVKFAFAKLGQLSSYAFEKAKFDPRTAADTARVEAAVANLDRSFSKLASNLSSVVLPTYIKLLNDGLTPFVNKLNEMKIVVIVWMVWSFYIFKNIVTTINIMNEIETILQHGHIINCLMFSNKNRVRKVYI